MRKRVRSGIDKCGGRRRWQRSGIECGTSRWKIVSNEREGETRKKEKVRENGRLKTL